MLSKKIPGGNVAFKIDISKAFDTLNWDFLIQVLNRFGFYHTFLEWILTILQSTKLSIKVNGSLVGYFPCSRGVRQGNPFSRLLFCITEEVLNKV